MLRFKFYFLVALSILSFNRSAIVDAVPIAPGSIVHLRGSSFAIRTETATDGLNPPFSLAGTTVKVNGEAARMFYVSPDEVVFVVPETVAVGAGEVVVTNADGFASRAEVKISSVAPNVFTAGNEGIILDSDTLQPAPFNPASGQRRLSIFATGLRHAASLSVTINGQPTIVETAAPGNLAGLDEIHVLLPASLTGAGSATLIVDADGIKSNPVSVLISGVAANKLVISQVFGGGGNSGAPFRNDFIEIFNAGDTPVNLAGWSVQYSGATATTWSATPLTSTVLSPGQYYLVQQAGGSNGAALPNPDATGTIAMAAGAGKVALVNSTSVLTGSCPNSANIVDLVGYGTNASCFRGAAPAPAASNTNAATRKTNGCTDTRNNSTDFALAPPSPRNTSTQINLCSITALLNACSTEGETLRLPHALAQRSNHHFAPAFWLRRFP
ncbi:MAG TPA: lamin tail domain-containing protein [Pyrinomonadaceae bacterium]|nr:lamin tail domain-containing protein [Pyrinomonadaceae bacterium]